jgi:hypothetical protein
LRECGKDGQADEASQERPDPAMCNLGHLRLLEWNSYFVSTLPNHVRSALAVSIGAPKKQPHALQRG